MGLISPSLSSGITSTDFEVFSKLSALAACLQASFHPPLVFRALSETLCGNHRLRVNASAVWRDFKRLAPLGFLPLQHLPASGIHYSEVCLTSFVALSGFGHPLSGFLLPSLGFHLSGPSVLGVYPFRAFFPRLSRSPLRASCSPALSLPASGLDDETVWAPELCSQPRACLAPTVVTPRVESLLSWGSHL
jgi:hypothetical protein